MKIRKLVIHNIASIADATLDFDTGVLKDESLFLICGETGAGKTTILDALTLALYGKTPRYADKRSKNEVSVGGFAFNDPRQLVRRGVMNASATLFLQGNDHREYEASWSVKANKQGKNKGLLQGDVWRWKDLSPTGIIYEKVVECNEVVRRAVGLEFDQFCRTSMLAQGQFTKFLLGTEDEKAEILEKLTDTLHYRQWGQRIAEKYNTLEEDVRQRETKLNAIIGLGEKRAEVEARLKVVTGSLVEIEDQLKTLEKRREWIQQEYLYSEQEQSIRGDLKRNLAMLKSAIANCMQEKERVISELDATKKALAKQVIYEPMFDVVEVILSELNDVKLSRQRESFGRNELVELEKQLPVCQKFREDRSKTLKEIERKVGIKRVELDAAERKLEKMGIAQLRKRLVEIQKVQGELKGVRTMMESLTSQKLALEKQATAFNRQKEELAQNESVLPELEQKVKIARLEMEHARTNRDGQKALIDDGIKKIVAELKVGEVCPICGNQIKQLNSEVYFVELIGKLNEECQKAERKYEQQLSNLNSHKAMITAANKAIKSLSEQITSAQNEGKRMLEKANEIVQELGLTEPTVEAIDPLLVRYQQELNEVTERLVVGERQELQIAQLRRESKQLDEVVVKAKEELAKAELNYQKCESDISSKRQLIQNEHERINKKIDAVTAKIVYPNWKETWEQDTAAFETSLKNAAKSHRKLKELLPKQAVEVANLEKNEQNMRECVSRAVVLWPELSEVEAVAEESKVTIATIDGMIGALNSLVENRTKHVMAKPDGLLATDTGAALQVIITQIKQQESGLLEEKGRLEQQIEADDQCIEERQRQTEALISVRAARDEWWGLHNLFGDKEGRKIRREIQTYVLTNVLTKANRYLKQLTDRYELSNEGLTLTVNDTLEGGVMRPVNTLSGGEGFIVSLALSLGLAGMNEQGLSTDLLFIDEGFGTLSGEHLNAAIETLEHLNVICGSRKVGIISHVERLRERIRTHIEVSRNGHDPSTVKVIVR